jgi:hypothetical protein
MPRFNNLKDVFAECLKVIDEAAFYEFSSECGQYSQRQSVMCRVYEALVDNDIGCNALGNNLNESMEDLKEFLQLGPRSIKPERDIRDYLMRMYLVVERMYEALRVVRLYEEWFVLTTDGMRAIREVKQWANFFKHPGAFLWCHDPDYRCLSVDDYDAAESSFVIDQSVVNDYYTNNKKNHDELHKKLSNATGIQVVFPELASLTERFCRGIDDFCQTISSPLFRDTPKKKSTIDDYFRELFASLSNISPPTNEPNG